MAPKRNNATHAASFFLFTPQDRGHLCAPLPAESRLPPLTQSAIGIKKTPEEKKIDTATSQPDQSFGNLNAFPRHHTHLVRDPWQVLPRNKTTWCRYAT